MAIRKRGRFTTLIVLLVVAVVSAFNSQMILGWVSTVKSKIGMK